MKLLGVNVDPLAGVRRRASALVSSLAAAGPGSIRRWMVPPSWA